MVHVLARRNVHDPIERITGGARFTDLADQLGQRLRSGQAGGKQAIPSQSLVHHGSLPTLSVLAAAASRLVWRDAHLSPNIRAPSPS
jgi:hypothetical protein